MLSELLKSKSYWESKRFDQSLVVLNRLFSKDTSGDGISIPNRFLKSYKQMNFESALSSILLNNHILVSFSKAFKILWKDLPGQYLIDILHQYEGIYTDVELFDFLLKEASTGIITTDQEYYHLGCKVVLTKENDSLILMKNGEGLFETIMESEKKWEEYAFNNKCTIVNMLFNSVFHVEPVLSKEAVLLRIQTIEVKFPYLLTLLESWLEEVDEAYYSELVEFNLRIRTSDFEKCIKQLLISLREEKVENFINDNYS
ncbi:MAG: hypothetical protein WBB45_15965 [Cyclobacteriaceae bacterium]